MMPPAAVGREVGQLADLGGLARAPSGRGSRSASGSGSSSTTSAASSGSISAEQRRRLAAARACAGCAAASCGRQLLEELRDLLVGQPLEEDGHLARLEAAGRGRPTRRDRRARRGRATPSRSRSRMSSWISSRSASVATVVMGQPSMGRRPQAAMGRMTRSWRVGGDRAGAPAHRSVGGPARRRPRGPSHAAGAAPRRDYTRPTRTVTTGHVGPLGSDLAIDLRRLGLGRSRLRIPVTVGDPSIVSIRSSVLSLPLARHRRPTCRTRRPAEPRRPAMSASRRLDRRPRSWSPRSPPAAVGRRGRRASRQVAPAGRRRRRRTATVLEGIDVSHWQGTINWPKVAAAGKKFAIIKATEGTNYVDPHYATNRAGRQGGRAVDRRLPLRPARRDRRRRASSRPTTSSTRPHRRAAT